MQDLNVIPIRRKKKGQEKINFILKNIHPLTNNQKIIFREYAAGKNIMALGSAGSGKSFLLIYLALNQLLRENSVYKKLIIVRSVLPTHEIGFLPGNIKEKSKIFEAPYISICNELFGRGDAYQYLNQKGIIEFLTTSFIRGITLNDCIVFVDECQNMLLHELDSIITRIGHESKLLFAGDTKQSDFIKSEDKRGLKDFLKIVKGMNGHGFQFIEFSHDDIVRSNTVKEYIIARDTYEKTYA